MAVTITLDNDLVAVVGPEPTTPGEVVARIQATVPNLSQIRRATANMAEVLDAAPDDPHFELESWKRQWSVVDAEMKAATRANDIAEARGSQNG